MRALDCGVAVVFVGIDMRARPGKLLDMRTQRRLLGIAHHAQPYLPTHAPNRPQHGWSVIGIGAPTTALIRPIAWRISRVEVLCPFFAGVLEQLDRFRTLGRIVICEGQRAEHRTQR